MEGFLSANLLFFLLISSWIYIYIFAVINIGF